MAPVAFFQFMSLPAKPWAKLSPEEQSFVLSSLAAITLAWTLLFIQLRYVVLRSRSYDFSNRVVSIVHVWAAITLCMLSVKDWSNPLANIGGANTPEQVRVIVVSLAYFIYDFASCLFDAQIDWVIVAHHICTVVGFAYGLASGTSGSELVACLWLMELSNPCMHGRELIKELQLKDTPIALVNDVLFALTFTVARMIVGPFIVYSTLQADSPLGIKAGALGIQIISMFWFYKIVRVVQYKVLGHKLKAKAT